MDNENITTKAAEVKAEPADDGGPAFPRLDGMEPADFGRFHCHVTGGMSLRDYFAAKAMASLIIDPARADQSRQECARLSYLMANAMIQARRAA